ncbi:hypothetical protein XELAEV_18006922mg [Xenopus laevis]|uniref:Uncharacterized protein n=1 Tax=Xenopus laevis TaxID=8355 RepID=A0A974I4I7_XENLA|nr:hypothetical protein XELAEV_18006922mg [Xenopus laevis]
MSQGKCCVHPHPSLHLAKPHKAALVSLRRHWPLISQHSLMWVIANIGQGRRPCGNVREYKLSLLSASSCLHACFHHRLPHRAAAAHPQTSSEHQPHVTLIDSRTNVSPVRTLVMRNSNPSSPLPHRPRRSSKCLAFQLANSKRAKQRRMNRIRFGPTWGKASDRGVLP